MSQIDTVEYSGAFRFETGIYTSYVEFTSNDPAIKEVPVKTENRGGQILATWFFGVFGNFFQGEKIGFTDSAGNTKKIARKKMWGYCKDGALYIRKGRLFHQATKIGAITHFARSNNSNWNKDHFRVSKGDPTDNQFIFDFETGEILKYNLLNVTKLISKDPSLCIAFYNLGNDFEMKRQMFVFIGRFNERNPISFPRNGEKEINSSP